MKDIKFKIFMVFVGLCAVSMVGIFAFTLAGLFLFDDNFDLNDEEYNLKVNVIDTNQLNYYGAIFQYNEEDYIVDLFSDKISFYKVESIVTRHKDITVTDEYKDHFNNQQSQLVDDVNYFYHPSKYLNDAYTYMNESFIINDNIYIVVFNSILKFDSNFNLISIKSMYTNDHCRINDTSYNTTNIYAVLECRHTDNISNHLTIKQLDLNLNETKSKDITLNNDSLIYNNSNTNDIIIDNNDVYIYRNNSIISLDFTTNDVTLTLLSTSYLSTNMQCFYKEKINNSYILKCLHKTDTLINFITVPSNNLSEPTTIEPIELDLSYISDDNLYSLSSAVYNIDLDYIIALPVKASHPSTSGTNICIITDTNEYIDILELSSKVRFYKSKLLLTNEYLIILEEDFSLRYIPINIQDTKTLS